MKNNIFIKLLLLVSCLSFQLTDAYADDVEEYQERIIRFYMHGGKVVDYDAANVDSITTTSDMHRIWKDNSFDEIYLADIDSVWYLVPKLDISSDVLNFGNVEIGEKKIRTLKLTNNGLFPEVVYLTKPEHFNCNRNEEEIRINPDETVEIEYYYTPDVIESLEDKFSISSAAIPNGSKEITLLAKSKEPFVAPEVPTISQRAYEETTVLGHVKMNDNSVFIREDVSKDLVDYDEENGVLVFNKSAVLDALNIVPGDIIYSTERTEMFPDGYSFKVQDDASGAKTRTMRKIYGDNMFKYLAVKPVGLEEVWNEYGQCYPIKPMTVESKNIVFYKVENLYDIDLPDSQEDVDIDLDWQPLDDGPSINFKKDGNTWTATYNDKFSISWDNEKDALTISYVLWKCDDQKVTVSGTANLGFGDGLEHCFQDGKYLVSGDFTYDVSLELEYSAKDKITNSYDKELLDRLKKQLVGKKFKLVDLTIPLPWALNTVINPKLEILLKFEADLKGKLTAHYGLGGQGVHYHFANYGPSEDLLSRIGGVETYNENLEHPVWIKGSIEGNVKAEMDLGLAFELPWLKMDWYEYDNSQVKEWKNYNSKKEKLNSFVGLYLTLGVEGDAKLAVQTNFSNSQVSFSINPKLKIGGLAEGAIGYRSKPLFCDQVSFNLLTLDLGKYTWSINRDDDKLSLLSPSAGAIFYEPKEIKFVWNNGSVTKDIVSYDVYVGKSSSVDFMKLYMTTENRSCIFCPSWYGDVYWYVRGKDAEGYEYESYIQNFRIRTIPQYVDFDLPSKTKWANANLGATMPWEAGDYYAWGETEPSKADYSWSTYKLSNGLYDTLKKYCTDSSFGKVDNKTELELEDDAVYADKNGHWRMPTAEEFDELHQYCTWEWTILGKDTEKQVGCWKVSRNEKYIYLPMTGSQRGENIQNKSSEGYYWTSSLNPDYSSSAQCYHLTPSAAEIASKGREAGMCIRPVINNIVEVTSVALDVKLVNMIPGGKIVINPSWEPKTLNKNEVVLQWVSTDPQVATVEDGVVTAIKPGHCVIRAVAGSGAEDECDIVVKSSSAEHYITPKYSTYTVAGAGGDTEISYLTDVTCEIKSNSSWITPKGYYVTIDKNPTEMERTAEITIHSDYCNYDVKVKIVQMPADIAELYVDLGLPSGTMWANFNVGSSNSRDMGNYYAWGETAAKNTYSWSNYKYCNGASNKLTKYCSKSTYGNNGYTDATTELESADDAATAQFGESACIPTKADWEELMQYCTWTKSDDGVIVKGPNGHQLLLPLAGYRQGVNLYDVGNEGYYWSSTLDVESPDDAWFMYVGSDNPTGYEYYRSIGRSIRPVKHVSQDDGARSVQGSAQVKQKPLVINCGDGLVVKSISSSSH